MKNNIVFFAVVFPSIEKYLDVFFRSLENQTFKAFDVCIINDGLLNFSRYKKKFKTLDIKVIDFHDSPIKIREFGFNYVLEKKYSAIVFGDADDYFATNRIEASVALLKDFDIVVNDLDLVEEGGKSLKKGYLSERIENKTIINPDYTRDKNIFGLSNTATKVDLINNILIDEEIIALDWFIFTQLLETGAKAVFTNETTTYYRQYAGNHVGIKALSKESILRAIKVKVLHYSGLIKVDTKYMSLYDQYNKLETRLTSDTELLDLYLEKITDLKIKNPLWWEEISLVEI